MKKEVVKNLLWVLALFILASSCSKEDQNTGKYLQQKSASIGDKVFIQDPYPIVFADNWVTPKFSDNSGQVNFTYSGIPGQGMGAGTNGLGYFKTENKTYPLTFGIAYHVGEHQYAISLYSQSFESPDEYDEIYFAGLNINSYLPNEIAQGVYPYSWYPAIGYLNLAYIAFDIFEYDPGYYYYVESGSLQIDTGTPGYSLYFEGTLDNGNSLIISYTGQLDIVVIDIVN